MKILMVEDETPAARRLQKMLERIMEDLGDWGKVPAEITWCSEPEAALAEAEHRPDLILLDLNLGCFNALSWIQGRNLPPSQTMIISAETRYCEEAFAQGIFAYLSKPIDESLLKRHLERFVKTNNLIA